jgi:hypothetical protein
MIGARILDDWIIEKLDESGMGAVDNTHDITPTWLVPLRIGKECQWDLR